MGSLLTFFQHYSCPTRLLDWSSSVFVALYFAVNSHFDKDGVIYAFNESETDKIAVNLYKDYSDLTKEELQDKNEMEVLYTVVPGEYFRRSMLQQGGFTISTDMLHIRGFNELVRH